MTRTLTPEESARLAEIRERAARESARSKAWRVCMQNYDPIGLEAVDDRTALLAIVDRLTNGPAWRPVTETEPAEDEQVLVAWPDGAIDIATRTMEYRSAGWTGAYTFGSRPAPSHWMPLPSRPTEEP